MDTIKMLTSNYVINVGFLSWMVAQILKTLFYFLGTKTLRLERMVGSGGMPSSHSSLVCSIAVAIGKKLGYSSPEFGLALAVAGIVMYDAMGVRRAAGEQAKLLNKMVVDFKDLFQMLKEDFDALTRGESFKSIQEENHKKRKELKEFLGHTPLEVLCGAILGILIAAIMPAH